MADKRDQTELAATELKDEDLNEAQGGLGLAISSESSTAKTWRRSRGNNVFGFEDLPNN